MLADIESPEAEIYSADSAHQPNIHKSLSGRTDQKKTKNAEIIGLKF